MSTTNGVGTPDSRIVIDLADLDLSRARKADLLERIGKARPLTPPAPTLADYFRLPMTVALGVGIPCLSLAMSKLAGTLATHGHLALAAFAFALMAAVLGVSLSHLSWAVGNVTRSGRRASWSLAVALDLSLILCELVHVYAADLGLGLVCTAVMACVAAASMALNVFAFLMHERPAGR
jgi:hypothetical protein